MKIVVTGASGDLGKRVTAHLMEQIPANQLILVTRTPHVLADAAAKGAQVRKGDFDDHKGLETAFAGGDRILIISSIAITRRIPQHRNAFAAAKAAGIGYAIYTSGVGIHPATPILTAKEHRVSEADLVASAMDFTILRNSLYSEIVATVLVGQALAAGEWISAAGEGMFAPVSKRDVARCAAACLLNPEQHKGAIYEITGPELFSYRKIVALAADVYGLPLKYVPVTAAELFAKYDALGIPRSFKDGVFLPDSQSWPSEEMVSADLGTARHFGAIQSCHVEMITGRPAVSLREVMQACKGKSYEQVQKEL